MASESRETQETSLTNRVLAGDPEVIKHIEHGLEDILKAYDAEALLEGNASAASRKRCLRALGRRFVEQIPHKCAHFVHSRDEILSHSVRRGDDERSTFRADIPSRNRRSLYPEKLQPEDNQLIRLFLSHGCQLADQEGKACLPRIELMQQAVRELLTVPSPEEVLARHAEELQKLQKYFVYSEREKNPTYESYTVAANNLKKGADATIMHTAKDWEGLVRQVSPKDLELFNGALKDAVLTGELIVDPVLLVGCHTIMRCSKSGEQVSLSLYNCLPIENTGDDLLPSRTRWNIANARFGKGKQVSIANPYVKLGMDGSRTVRVDDPRDVRVLNEVPTAVAAAKDGGNAALKMGRFEMARQLYRSCFAHSEVDDFVMFLNHRSANSLQAVTDELEKRKQKDDMSDEEKFQLLPQAHVAMLDAAAVLCLRPGHDKCWERYIECTEVLRKLGPDPSMDLLSKCLNGRAPAEGGEPFFPDSPGDVSELHSAKTGILSFGIAIGINDASPEEKGNASAPSKDRPLADIAEVVQITKRIAVAMGQLRAKQNYTAARREAARGLLLLSSARPLIQVLCNLAHVALKVGRDMEAMAYAFATLRLCAYHTECDLNEEAFVGVMTPKKPPPVLCQDPGMFAQLAEKATFRLVKALTMLGTTDVFDNVQHLRPGFDYLKTLGLEAGDVQHDWVCPQCEPRVVSKVVGRGVFATRSIPEGQTIGLQTRVGVTFLDKRPERDIFYAPDLVSDEDSAGGIGLLNKIMLRIGEDIGLAGRLNHMFAPEHPLDRRYPKHLMVATPFDYFMNRLPAAALPYLLPLPEFALGPAVRLTAAKVENTLRQNGMADLKGTKDPQSQGASSNNNVVHCIFPVVAMLNHEDDPNIGVGFCADGADGSVVMVAKKNIEAGQEVTLSYFAGSSRPIGMDRSKWGF